jgi:4-hydroxybenzoate polyprenyltransferase
MRFSSLWDRLFLMRPTILVPVWTFLLLGNYHSSPEIPILVPDRRLLLALLSYTMLLGGVYILNQLYDRESDRLNKKLFLIPEGYIQIKSAVVQMAILIGVGFSLSVFFSPIFLVFVGISLIMGILYSAPPVKLKGKPVLDTIANGVGYGFVNFGVGWLATASLSMRMVELSLPYVFAVGAVYVNTTILDLSGDRRIGDITTGVWLGDARARLLSTLLLSVALLLSILLENYVCLLACSIALPLFVLSAVRIDVKSVLISIRLGTPVLAVIASFLYPFFAGILLAGFFLTRWYYRNRFGVIYPSILEKKDDSERAERRHCAGLS